MMSFCVINILVGSESEWKRKVPFVNFHPKYQATSSFHDKYSSDQQKPFHAIWIQNRETKRISCWFVYTPVQRIAWGENKDKIICLFLDLGNKNIKILEL